jgi:hypothetical protein
MIAITLVFYFTQLASTWAITAERTRMSSE